MTKQNQAIDYMITYKNGKKEIETLTLHQRLMMKKRKTWENIKEITPIYNYKIKIY